MMAHELTNFESDQSHQSAMPPRIKKVEYGVQETRVGGWLPHGLAIRFYLNNGQQTPSRFLYPLCTNSPTHPT